MKLHKKCIRSLKKEYFNSFDFKHNCIIDFGNLKMKLNFNQRKLAEIIEEYFKYFLTDETNFDVEIFAAQTKIAEYTLEERKPRNAKPKERYYDTIDGRIIRKVLTGMVFMMSGGDNLALGPCIENSNQVINFINNRYIDIMLKKDCLLYHAAAVHSKTRGLGCVGFSNTGKSTLALHLLRHGFDFVSNDRLMVKSTRGILEMYGVIKYPRINPGTIITIADIEDLIPKEKRDGLKRLPQRELWNLDEKYDLFFEAYFKNSKFCLNTTMDGLVVLNWKHNNTPLKIDQIDIETREDLLPTFMKSLGVFHTGAKTLDHSKEAYTKQLRNIQVFEVTGGVDFPKTAQYFADFLRKGEQI